MAVINREEWDPILRDVEWDISYVDRDMIYPEWLSGGGEVPEADWERWREDYHTTFRDYATSQAEKETAAYAVMEAMRRSSVYDDLTEGWKSATKMHFGGVSSLEYLAALGELRMARFGLSGSWRNMAVFGVLDEIRHTQITLALAHTFIHLDPQYDWAQKAYHTDNWVTIAMRCLLDRMISSASAVDVAIQLPFTLESGFTNLQFVALSADALRAGDIGFSNMVGSIQTDEARHSQQGGPTLEILLEHDPVRAERLIHKMFWLAARAFAALTGPVMDYYSPLDSRTHCYREFIEEWVVGQYKRSLADYGIGTPWYWDDFMQGLDTWHHGMHLGFWLLRPTVWWNSPAGVSDDERDWLREKYPDWQNLFGAKWDLMATNLQNGVSAAGGLTTLPWLCSNCHLPNLCPTRGYDGRRLVRDWSLRHNGRTHHFCSRACRQYWWDDRDTLNLNTLTDRLLFGEIQPPDLPGVLAYMGLDAQSMGSDATGESWIPAYGRTGAGVA
ncbi:MULTISPECIES: toluene monooxygenase [unclassified Crossiella]|uniref:toluene monooxygenase n=1 Tax=unclassified Crossiella TaxID=2620835 RepID=UPI001FFF515E|nr:MULTISPECIES: toluene monooxygenase [unclassified Crossiella]MCK2239043.1 toluene monooxygenase [Crossiella sp. S99.2]MCK2251388.1 toluene monooxygenase [Crossiella sp. S99.1]